MKPFNKKGLAILLLPGLLAACSLVGIRSGYEAPAYTVLESRDEALEVRRYAPRLAAEARLDAEGEDGRNAAFRLLFDYITGANRDRAKIAMTAPVEESGGEEPGGQVSREIAMTVPVETEEAVDGEIRMRFFLPSEFNAENAPEPLDSRISLAALPEETFAVLVFSGLQGDAKIAGKKSELLQALESSAWQAIGEPVTLFYDPPWTLPFFRRNEVAVPVRRAGS